MSSYKNARSVFMHKWGRYSKTEKLFIIYAIVLGACLIFLPIINISPIGDTNIRVFRLLETYFLKSDIIVFLSFLILVGWSTSFRFKAFINQVIGFKENDSLLSLGLLLMMTTAFIAIGDTTTLVKDNFTYTVSLTNGYYFISLLLLAGIIYTLRQALSQARYISKANMVNIHSHKEEDKENFNEHLKQGLFEG